MNTPSPSAIQITDLFEIFSKYASWIVTCTVLSIALFAMAGLVVPKRYKTDFVLAIHSDYFQNPLTHDLTPTVYDTSEMRSQRESLIRQTLSLPFIDSLGEKYGIYQSSGGGLIRILPHSVESLLDALGIAGSTRGMSAHSEERQDLISRIQVLNLSGDTFEVSFIYSDPEVTFQVIQDIYNQVTGGLMAVRRNNMIAARDAIQSRLNSLSSSLPPPPQTESAANPVPISSIPENNSAEIVGTSSVPDAFDSRLSVDQELADVRNQIQVFSIRYTENHPLMKELRQREQILTSLQKAGLANPSTNSPRVTPPLQSSFIGQAPPDAIRDLYSDLLRKLNYLNISLESDQSNTSNYFATLQSPLYPIAPLGPKEALFILWGFAVGFVGSFFMAAIRETFDRTALHAPVLSQKLGLPLLGKLPVVPWTTFSRIQLGHGRSLRVLQAEVK